MRRAMLAFTLLGGLIAATGSQGGKSVFEARPTARPDDMELRVVGRPTFKAGSRAALRAIVVHPVTDAAIEGAAVDILLGEENVEGDLVWSGLTDARGTAQAVFDVPDVDEGRYQLTVRARAGTRRESVRTEVEIERAAAIYLSTDKPLYQPGQVMFVRALALSRPQLLPIAGRELELVIEDPRGNKVFKRKLKTDPFGVAAAEFSLASEVNMGAYRVSATVAGATADRTVNVERYVLPKFKVVVTTDKPFYRPGETVKGKVQVDYLFGKPVAGGAVEVKGRVLEVDAQPFASLSGRTSAEGAYTFEATLPKFLVGQDLFKGKAPVEFFAVVEDKASHREEGRTTVVAGLSPLSVDLIPDGVLQKSLPGTVFVAVADGDGSPAENAEVTLTVGAIKKSGKTDGAGVAAFALALEGPQQAKLHVRNARGDTWTGDKPLEVSASDDALAIFTDKALYKGGETVKVNALSTLRTGPVYVDLVREGQTAWTTSGELRDGRAEWSFDLPPDLAGTVVLSAYAPKRSLNFVRASRSLMVQPARDLRIGMTLDREAYKPGEKARLLFDVRDSGGALTAAALGVYIVDEAVFARAEAAPGLEKVFFLLEKEILTPRFEVHAFEPRELVEPLPHDLASHDRRQSAARVLLAAAARAAGEGFALTSRAEKIKNALIDAERRLRNAAVRYQEKKGSFDGDLKKLVAEGLLMEKDLRDPFGGTWVFRGCGCGRFDHGVVVYTLGPDGKDKSGDESYASGGQAWGGLLGERQFEGRLRGQGGIGRPGVVGFGRVADMAPRAQMHAEQAARAEVMKMGATAEAAPAAAAGSDARLAEVGRVRQYFPETLFVQPLLVAGPDGKAELEVPLADSITTWRLWATGSTKAGLLGHAQRGLRVFQDFFIDPDLPLALTVGDEVSIPVAVHNYLAEPQRVQVKLERADWFELQGEDTRLVEMGAGEVSAVFFRLKALRPGPHRIAVQGRGTRLADAVRKEVEVVPNGFQAPFSRSGVLEKRARASIAIPADALPGGTALFVRVYPGAFAQVVDGVDKILQMPSGCFEQTSSTTYPNLLVLDYLRTLKKATPEVEMKARAFVAHGYQRLLTFEVQGGGFSWFGDAPANQVLTAYGLMEFADMSRVHEVDERLIHRTRAWLASRQRPDGGWDPDKAYLHAENWAKVQGKDTIVSAYLAWALAETGEDNAVARALDFLRKRSTDEKEPYVLALMANAFLARDRADATGRALLDRLTGMALERDGALFWRGMASVTYASGISADVETTALAALAFLKAGTGAATVTRALKWIVAAKDASGNWHSTMATTLALKALLKASPGQGTRGGGTVAVSLDGREVGRIQIAGENAELMQQLDLNGDLAPGQHEVALAYSGEGALMFQVAGRAYRPWEARPEPPQPLLALDVKYDRTSLARNETMKVKVKASVNVGQSAQMVMIDVGVPPGFEVEGSSLARLLERKVIGKYGQTPRQVMLYVPEIQRGRPFEAEIEMRARYPIRAVAPEGQAYLYYTPEERTVVRPVLVQVTGR